MHMLQYWETPQIGCTPRGHATTYFLEGFLQGFLKHVPNRITKPKAHMSTSNNFSEQSESIAIRCKVISDWLKFSGVKQSVTVTDFDCLGITLGLLLPTL